MTIMPFDAKKEETAVEPLAYEQLTGSFVDQKRFNVIEREKLEQVLLERESGRWRWALLQLVGLTAVAYLTSLLVYQLGRLVV